MSQVCTTQTPKVKKRNRSHSRGKSESQTYHRSLSRDNAYYLHMTSPRLGQWPEVETAMREGRKELVIVGGDKHDKVEPLPDELYECEAINYLNVSRLPQLTVLPAKVRRVCILFYCCLCFLWSRSPPCGIYKS
jgi:hypothetical protein